MTRRIPQPSAIATRTTRPLELGRAITAAPAAVQRRTDPAADLAHLVEPAHRITHASSSRLTGHYSPPIFQESKPE